MRALRYTPEEYLKCLGYIVSEKCQVQDSSKTKYNQMLFDYEQLRQLNNSYLHTLVHGSMQVFLYQGRTFIKCMTHTYIRGTLYYL